MEVLGTGLALTAWGMGLVFLLLALLWALTSLLLHLDRPGGTIVTASAPTGPDPELLAAIVLAVREHRRVRRKQAAPAMRSLRPGALPSRWVGAGRTRQNRSWSAGGRYS